MYDFLYDDLKKFVMKNRASLRELRLRKNCPVSANLDGVFQDVKVEGYPYVLSENCLNKIVSRLCENSLYKYNDSIKNGYITIDHGIRIGVAGECVIENGEIKTIKNFTSLCVRFPHEIIGCANHAFSLINDEQSVKSLLVISKPGVGKTTLLRDLIRIISNIKRLNILVIDEKNEIFYDACDIGQTIDVLSSCNKQFGFYTAVKTLCPDVVVADELTSEADAQGAMFASLSGVKILCSVHGSSLEDVYKKPYMANLIKENCFEKYVLLEKTLNGYKSIEVGL